MDNPDRTIARLVRDRHGMVHRATLLDAGVSRRAIERRLEKKVLLEAFPAVYRHAAASVTADSFLMGAVLGAGDDAVASHRSASRLSDLRDVPRARPEVTTPHSDLPRLRGVLVHRTKQLDPADVTIIRGIPTTTLPRTLLDLGAVLPFEVVELAAQDAIIRNLTSPAHLVALLERVGRRGRNGTTILRAVVAQSLPDERVQSELERRLHALIKRSTLPAPVLQHPVGEYFLDFAWPERKLAAEADGRRWHATKRDFEKALVRRRWLRTQGWDVHHFGWADIVEQATQSLAYLNRLVPLAA